uniref:Uncharacterized protein n=1 Tax=Mastacembelus armatus TaxID=205130 RepID=A0A7N8YD08_9TELE
MPGTLPTRLTTILSLLFPVRTFTALLMVMLSKLMPLTSTSLSPTSRPACSLCVTLGSRGFSPCETGLKIEPWRLAESPFTHAPPGGSSPGEGVYRSTQQRETILCFNKQKTTF